MAGEVEISITPKSKRLIGRLIKRIGKDQLYSAIEAFFSYHAGIIAGIIVTKFLSGKHKDLGENRLARRTGALARSVVGVGLRINGVPAIKVGVLRGPSLRYVAIQEYGTVGKGGTMPTIVPKQGKALAIPMEGATTPSGVEKYGGPRKYPGPEPYPDNLTFIPFRGKKAIGGLYDPRQLEKAKKRGLSLKDLKMAYLLVRSVDIKPKHFLRDGLANYLPTLISEFQGFLSRVIQSEDENVRSLIKS